MQTIRPQDQFGYGQALIRRLLAELDAIAGHEAHSAFYGGEVAEGGEFIQQVEDRHGGLGGIAGHVGEALGDEQAQPARIGRKAIGRQDEEHRDVAALEIGKAEIGAGRYIDNAGAVEEMGMALCGREDAGRLAVGFRQMAICGAGDQAARRRAGLHVLQHGEEGVRGGGEAVAHHFKGAVLMGIVAHDIEDEAGNERLGFLVPMRLAGHARLIEHEGVGKGAGVFREIEAGRVELAERIEGGRGLAGDAEGVEDVDRPELLASAAGDPGILALGSMQITERSAVSRFGMMVPTPLPVLVGAIVSRWAGPS